MDDDEWWLEFANKFLTKINPNYEFIGTTDPSKVLALLSKNKNVDIIISDYQMAEMNGIELLIEVKETYNDLPFIILTGRANKENFLQAIQAGAKFVISKNENVEYLFALLDYYIVQSIKEIKYNRFDRENVSNFQLFLDLIPKFTSIWNLQNDYLMLSFINKKGIESKFGTIIEKIGQPAEKIFIKQKKLIKEMYIVLNSGNPKVVYHELKPPLVKIQQNFKISLFNIKDAINPKGKILLILSIFTENLSKEESNSDKMIKTYLLGLKHDINNLNSYIRSNISLYKETNDIKLLNNVENAINVFDRYINPNNELLDMNKLMDREWINLKAVILDLFSLLVPKESKLILINLLNDKIKVFGELNQVNQIFYNILENAINHGDPKIIEISYVEASEGGIYILIENDGKEIPKKLRKNIFKISSSTQKNKNGDTGLGLAIVKEICDNHGWSIYLQDTTKISFQLYIPGKFVINPSKDHY